MAKPPSSISQLMRQPEYLIKNSKINRQVSDYFKTRYPNEMQYDDTGKAKEPKFDMTLEQFIKAQTRIDSDFNEAKQKAYDEIMDE
jgi:hypothetical protein